MADDAPPGARVSEVTVIATSSCNQRCSYCYVKGRPAASPPWSAVRAALDALLSSPVDHVQVGFTGGEPLLAQPLVTRAVNYVQTRRRPDQRVRYKLLTNGLLLDQRTLSWLERHAFHLQISADGTRNAQDYRSPGTFDALDRLIRTMKGDSPRYFRSQVSVAMTLTPETVAGLADSVGYLLDAGVNTIRLTPASGVPPSRDDVFPELDRQFARVYKRALAEFRRTGDVPVAAFRKRLPWRTRPPASPWVCRAPLGASLVVDVDGQVSTCLLATKSYAEARHLPPSLRKAADALRLSSPKDRLGGPLRQVGGLAPSTQVFSSGTRRHSICGPCRQCQWSGECLVCPLMTTGVVGAKRSLRVPAFLCAFNRAMLKHRARFPFQPPASLIADVFGSPALRNG